MIWEFGYVLIEEDIDSSRVISFSDTDEEELLLKAQQLNDEYTIECSNFSTNEIYLTEYQTKYDAEYYNLYCKDRSFSKEKLQKFLEKNPIIEQLSQIIGIYNEEGLLGFSDDPSNLELTYYVKEIGSYNNK